MISKPPGPGGRPEAASVRRLRDPYADLLRDSRGLRREQSVAREAWFTALSLDKKEDALFEFEMLLKAVACWSNPRNHPGATPKVALHDRDFRPQLKVAKATIARALVLVEMLTGTHWRAPGFKRYLELPTLDDTREAVLEGPEESLAELRLALMTAHEILEGLSACSRVSFRLFFAAIAPLQREVARNGYFNPLVALEFRPEFDRIRQQEVLESLQTIEGEAAHRLAALACLSCFRLLRLTQLVQTASTEPEGTLRGYALLSVIRSDARALVHLLRQRSGTLLADVMERDLMKVPAADLRLRFEPLAREVDRLVRLRATFYGVGSSLRAEVKRAFNEQIPACGEHPSGADLSGWVQKGTLRMREVLQTCVLQVLSLLRGATDAEKLFADPQARKASSERTRQSAWMFLLVTRAFIAKARALPDRAVDGWEAPSAHEFLLDFVRYFRAIGQHLAIETEYPETERLIHTLESLRDADYVSPAGLSGAVSECETFTSHLQTVIEKVGRRDELKGVALDKRAAAESLRMYLGA